MASTTTPVTVGSTVGVRDYDDRMVLARVVEILDGPERWHGVVVVDPFDTPYQVGDRFARPAASIVPAVHISGVTLVTGAADGSCRHGIVGFCHDDATPAQREAFDFAYRHAYDWALTSGQDRDAAEAYAAWFAAENYDDGFVGVSHSREWERYAAGSR